VLRLDITVVEDCASVSKHGLGGRVGGGAYSDEYPTVRRITSEQNQLPKTLCSAHFQQHKRHRAPENSNFQDYILFTTNCTSDG